MLLQHFLVAVSQSSFEQLKLDTADLFQIFDSSLFADVTSITMQSATRTSCYGWCFFTGSDSSSASSCSQHPSGSTTHRRLFIHLIKHTKAPGILRGHNIRKHHHIFPTIIASIPAQIVARMRGQRAILFSLISVTVELTAVR